MSRFASIALTVAALLSANSASAADHEQEIRKILPEIRNAVVQQDMIDALRAYNEERRYVTQTDIDKMSAVWLSELTASDHPLISSVVESPLAKRLRRIMKDRRGLINEIGVIDTKGLEIAQTNAYSDFWQGGNERFFKTFRTGPNAVFIDVVEHDSPTQSIGSQANFSIADPDTGEAIGLVTINFNLAGLE